MKRLLHNTFREMFGIDRQFTNFEVILFCTLVAITTGLVVYLI